MYSMDSDEIKKQALSLPTKERLKLADELYESCSEEELQFSSPEIEEAWDQEIRRRIKELDEGKAKGRPLKDVLDDLNAKYGWKN